METAKGIRPYTVSAVVHVPVWASAVEYLASHSGRWVTGMEIGDFVYKGICSPRAPHALMRRARQAGIPIESSYLGYRIGRDNSLACPTCGSLRVRYPDGELVCYGCVGTQFAELEVGRASGEGERSGKPWTPEEEAFVRANQHRMSQAQMGELLQRSEPSVRGYMRTRGLEKRYVLTQPRGRRK